MYCARFLHMTFPSPLWQRLHVSNQQKRVGHRGACTVGQQLALLSVSTDNNGMLLNEVKTCTHCHVGNCLAYSYCQDSVMRVNMRRPCDLLLTLVLSFNTCPTAERFFRNCWMWQSFAVIRFHGTSSNHHYTHSRRRERHKRRTRVVTETVCPIAPTVCV